MNISEHRHFDEEFAKILKKDWERCSFCHAARLEHHPGRSKCIWPMFGGGLATMPPKVATLGIRAQVAVFVRQVDV